MKISIVTPSFRQLVFLKRCAASVADQTGEVSVEHLIQDGGGGRDLAEWAEQQDFADFRTEADSGMYDAINRGFLRATGDLVAWLNCDEQYLPGALREVATWFQTHPRHDILFGDVVLVSADGRPLSYRQAIRPIRSHIRNCFLPTYSAATFVRRRIIDDGHLLDDQFKTIADAVWIHGLLGRGYRSGVLNKPLAVFTQTGENLGQTEAGANESRQWRGKSRVSGQLWSAVHRLRKVIAGCYRRRPVVIEVYPEGGQSRVSIEGTVSEIWKTSH